jgi:hypothetical protein
LSSTRLVKSMPTVATVVSHVSGRQFALVLPMKRFSDCAVFSCHEYPGVQAR